LLVSLFYILALKLYNSAMSKLRLMRWTVLLILALGLLPGQTGSAQQPAALTLLTPGEGSLVTSPIHLSAEIHASPQGVLRLALVDQGGRDISRQLWQIIEISPGSAVETIIPYEIPSDSAEALLTLSLLDAKGRPISVRSVPLTLQSSGEARLKESLSTEPWLTFIRPVLHETITGGTLVVEGSLIPLTDSPVFFELVTFSGKTLISKQLPVTKPGIQTIFEVSLPYSIQSLEEDVRLVVRQVRYPFVVTAILDSMLLNLAP